MSATLSLVTGRRATSQGVVGFLSQLPGLRQLPGTKHGAVDAIDRLVDLSDVRRVRRGEALWETGESSDFVAFVRGGVVLLRQRIADHEVTLDVCGRGCLLGLDAGRREHDAVAHDDTTLIVVRRADFDAWMIEHPEVAPMVLELVGHLGRRMAARLALVSMHGARARLAMLFVDLADRFGVRDSRGIIIDVRLTHREMANLIGATRETVSVAIVELRKDGLINTESRRVIVVDEEALRRVAGL